MIVLILYGFFLFLFLLGLLWVFIPAVYGLPSRPTNPERIRAALKLANLQPNEVLYDLGAGDGRVLLIAAKEFGARAVGVEIGPVQCALIWLRVTASGFGNKIQLQWGNFFTADLKEADVVFIYATSRQMPRLASHLANQLKIGARIVSISADFSEWEPSHFDEPNLIFVYAMPPKEGSLTTYLLKNSV
ncbi:MAG: class I SAM-dependent methyltransferase [Anaerolineales bacterium]|nr:class I SAM-dependent methyltransferase [Anaerolineales bacterium]